MTDISVKNGSDGSYGLAVESFDTKKVTADFNNAARIDVSGAMDVLVSKAGAALQKLTLRKIV